jgi:hypothetical protein
LSLVLRALGKIKVVREGRLLVHVRTPVALNKLLEASENKITISFTLGSKIAILVKLSLLKPAH